MSDAPPKLWKEELKRAYIELRGARITPFRGAAAVALGLWVGSIPAFGLHTPVVLAVCILLQLDGLLAWVASNVSNPFFAPFLVFSEVQVGAYVLTGAPLDVFDVDAARDTGVSGVLTYAFAGAPFVATAIALAGGIVVYVFLLAKERLVAPGQPRPPYALPDHAPAWWHAVERVAHRYAPLAELSTPRERTRFNYVRVKMLTDPVAQMVAGQLDEVERVSDVGTGRGQLPITLLEMGKAQRVWGVDWDAEKIEGARQAAAADPDLQAEFVTGDMRVVDIPPADAVLLIDVLHYLPVAEQDAVLRRAARAVKPGGRLLLRDADTQQGWRSWFTLAEEKIFTTLRFNRGAKVVFRASSDLCAVLADEGLSAEVRPAWGGTPFSNVLIIARRP